MGGCGILDPDKASRYLDYVLGAIAAVAEPAPQTKPGTATHYFRTTAAVRCPANGFWQRSVDEGHEVKAGAILGEVIQLVDLKATPVLASADGIVGAVRKKAQVSAGDELAWLFCS